MSEKNKQALIEAFLNRARQEGRLEEAQATIARLTANFNAVREQAAADQPLVDAFLRAYGTEPQSIRAVNVIAGRWGGFGAHDATITHEAPEAVQ